jgi:hypothetical protein
MITLPASMRVHNLFDVSLLKKYVSDPNHIIDWTMIQVEHEGDFRVEPIHILDWKVKVFGYKSIGMVKVQWNCYSLENTTWEHKKNTREEYPQFFVNFEENKI